MYGSIAAIAILSGGYAIFLHPINADVTLVSQKYSTRSIMFSRRPRMESKIFSFLPGQLLKKTYNNAVLSFPASNLNILTIGLGQHSGLPLPAPGVNLGLSIGFKGDGHGEPIHALMFGTLDCDTATQAADAAEHSSVPGIPLNLDGAQGNLSGLAQRLEVITHDKSSINSAIYVPNGQQLIEIPSSDPNFSGHTLVSIFGNVEVPTLNGVSIILSAVPDIFRAIMIARGIPKRIEDIPNVELSLTGVAGRSTFALPKGMNGSGECRTTPFDTPPESGPLPSENNAKSDKRFVIVIKDAQPQAVISIPMGLSSLLFKTVNDEPRISRNMPASFITWMRVEPIEGELKVGKIRTKLQLGDKIDIASGDITISDERDGAFTANAESRYVILNGDMLTVTLWRSIDSTTRAVIVSGMIGAIGWLLSMYWRSIVGIFRRIW
jgi:hypothetical protein